MPRVPDASAPSGPGDFQLEVERIRHELAVKARNALVAAAAHDLRSPLNGIQGWTHVLESRVGSESPLVRRALAGIQNGVEQQAQLIGDLTDMLHIMNGTMTLHPEIVSLHGMLQCVLNGMREATEARKIEFVLNGEDLMVWADPGRLTQAIERVLAHVVRIAVEGEQIVIAADRADSSDVSLRIAGQSGLVSPAKSGSQRSIKIPAAMSLAYRLVELNRGRMQSTALDGDGAREAFVITLMSADVRAAWHENDSQADVAHRGLVAARAHVSLHPLRIAVIGGEGGDALKHVLQGLGAHVDLVDQPGSHVPTGSHDLIMLPSGVELAAPTSSAVPRLIYGQDRAAFAGASEVAGSVPATAEPLQLAAAVLVATRFDAASQPPAH